MINNLILKHRGESASIKLGLKNVIMDISLKQPPQDRTILPPHFRLPFLVKI
jgi:hypothetical protein